MFPFLVLALFSAAVHSYIKQLLLLPVVLTSYTYFINFWCRCLYCKPPSLLQVGGKWGDTAAQAALAVIGLQASCTAFKEKPSSCRVFNRDWLSLSIASSWHALQSFAENPLLLLDSWRQNTAEPGGFAQRKKSGGVELGAVSLHKCMVELHENVSKINLSGTTQGYFWLSYCTLQGKNVSFLSCWTKTFLPPPYKPPK
jgi:hypothetical protein